jgi:hypothetical protein
MLDWDALRTFLAVARATRISEAARQLDDRFHESDSMLGVFAADSHFVAS